MSDLSPHSRDDLDFLPSDCELPTPPVQPAWRDSAEAPAVANVGHPCSYYLTLKPRTLSQAVTDISRVRDLPEWCWDLLRPRSNLVSLAEVRRARRRV